MTTPGSGTPVFGTPTEITNHRLKTVELATAKLDEKLEGLTKRNDERFDAVDTNILELTKVSARTAGITEGMAKQLEEQAQIRVVQQTTTLEVAGARARTELEDAANRKKFGREIILKVLAGIGAIWALISAIWLSRCA